MKKNARKLGLARETLRNLESKDLEGVIGGKKVPTAVGGKTCVSCADGDCKTVDYSCAAQSCGCPIDTVTAGPKLP